MKGRLKKIEDKWVVEYSKIKYVGGNPKVLGSYSKKIQVKTLPLLPKNQEYMNRFLYVDNNTKVDFKEVLINPMGREVDPNNLGQNHSGCVWYAELIYDENEEPKKVLTEEDIFNQRDIDAVTDYINKETSKQEQKQHLIDIMRGDEELGLYDESSPAYNHQARLVNDLAKEIKFEDIFNDEKRELLREFISKYPKAITIDELIDRYIEETGYGMDMWSKEETNTFTTIKKILYDRK